MEQTSWPRMKKFCQAIYTRGSPRMSACSGYHAAGIKLSLSICPRSFGCTQQLALPTSPSKAQGFAKRGRLPRVKIQIVPPVNIPIPTKIGSLKWVVNSPTNQNDTKTVLTTTATSAPSSETFHGRFPARQAPPWTGGSPGWPCPCPGPQPRHRSGRWGPPEETSASCLESRE